MATQSVELVDITKRFGGKLVVDSVCLEVDQGEFVVILGPSGCGKTTTLRMLAGLESPESGRISVGGKIVTDAARGVFVRPEHRDIGMVFQSYAIWPHLTVFENVAFPLRVRRMAKREIEAKVAKVLALVGLAGESQRSATALSGGQMQRVALARALVFDPALLLFDEPLSNLDLKLREHLRGELKKLQRETGLTSVYVTHDQAEAVELADRVIVMQGGKVVQVGAPEMLFRRPRSRFVAEFIATANVIDGKVEALLGEKTARIGTPCGTGLSATFEQPISIGQDVQVVVHPEDCVLLPVSKNDAGYPARVIEQQYQGTSTRYLVDWNGTPFQVVVLGTYSRLETGSAVHLAIDPACATIIPR